MKRILLFTLLAFAIASCSGDDNRGAVEPVGEGGAAGLAFSPEVAASGNLSRAAVVGNNFLAGNEVGYIVLGAPGAITNAGVPHIPGYGNVKAVGGRIAPPENDGVTPNYADTWVYYVNNLYVGVKLAGYPSYGNLDIYGYYPYNPAVTEADINAIPFSIGVLDSGVVKADENTVSVDYMWATPQLDYNIDPVLGDPTPVPMKFSHLMTYLEFSMRKLYYGPALTVKEVHFEISGNSRTFVTKGTYDLANGSVSATETTDKIVIKYTDDYKQNTLANGSASNSYIYCPIIMPELTCRDDDSDDATITVRFVLSDHESSGNGGNGWDFQDGGVYSFKLSDIVAAGGEKGLLAGKKYTVNIDISNGVKYSGVPQVADEWTAGDTGDELGIIEI